MNISRIIVSALLAMMAAAFVLVIAAQPADGGMVPMDTEGVVELADGWSYQEADGEQTPLTLPADKDLPAGTVMRVSRSGDTLPNGENTLCIRTSQQTLQVLVGDEVIYDYGAPETRPFGKSPGSAWHLIRLPKNIQGQRITLQFSSPYAEFSGHLNSVMIGTKAACLIFLFKQSAVSFLVCIFIGLTGLILIAVHLFVGKKVIQMPGLLYLGLFAVLIAVWSMTETRMVELLWPNAFGIYLITFLSLALVPIPFLLFLKAIITPKRGWLLDGLCGLLLINAVVCVILQIADILDLFETLRATHVLLLLTVIVGLGVLVEEAVRYKNKNLRALLLWLVVLSGCALLDMVRFYAGNYTDNAFGVRIGLLIFIIGMSVTVLQRMLHMVTLGMESETYERLAKTDMLTQCGNRRAFDAAVEELPLEKEKKPTILLMLDLNDFKQINDRYGHSAGDQVLASCGRILRKSCGESGQCFRIGGDEFVVLFQHHTAQEVEACIEDAQRRLADYNAGHVPQWTIAYGYAVFDPLQDQDAYSLLNRADQAMYRHKRALREAVEKSVLT